MKNNKNPKTINLYGFGGILLALNALILPQTANLNSVIQKVVSPAAQAEEVAAEEAPAKPNVSYALANRPSESTAAAKKSAVNRVIYVTVTAYSSTPDQTDDTPFITANGTSVKDGIIAANFLRFGAKVKFPDYSGNKIYEVTDRMNARYPNRADIWMETREEAVQFGLRRLKMEILPATLADKN